MRLIGCLLVAYGAATWAAPAPSSCSWTRVTSRGTATGGADPAASYHSFRFSPAAGDRLLISGRFPHARYFSWTISAENGMTEGTFLDRDIRARRGRNPFRPGVDRKRDYLGEYALSVHFGKGPLPKSSNTLAIADVDAKKVFTVSYRVYSVDQRFALSATADSGGVKPPVLRFVRGNGSDRCPEKAPAAPVLPGPLGAPAEMLQGRDAPAADHPIWWHSGNAGSRIFRLGNPGAVYVTTSVSSSFGPLLVLRWKGARTSGGTYRGQPLRDDDEMRFWSLLIQKNGRTLHAFEDHEVPIMPDGSRQLVVGFNNQERPFFVPASQWVRLSEDQGRVVMRHMLIDAQFPGNLEVIPPGVVPTSHLFAVPGGVYCTVEQLRANPDIGIRW